ncbi:fimbria/pilus outer membrane usher protein [Pseudescherichia vulneris]
MFFILSDIITSNINIRFRTWTVRLACVSLAGLCSFSASANDTSQNAPDEAVFDSGFLRGLGQNIDLSEFEHSGSLVPGKYILNISVNGQDSLRQEIEVISGDKGKDPRICFTLAEIKRWGVKLDALPDQEKVQQALSSPCIEVQKLIPDAHFVADIANLSGALSIPQAYASRVRRNYVDPSEWDDGVTAGILSYRANAFYNENGGAPSQTDYSVNINAGFNMLGWRLRHNGNYNDSDGLSEYDSLNSYAQTDIDTLRSQLTVGEYFTPGNDFNSIPFTGIQLGSDDSMLPESERGFAPAIRGTAETNAKVTVRQGGNIVYESNVAPGPFVIDDLYATGYAGDLDVTVTEADGREKTFTVPFSALVQMLRPGASRYNLAAGRYRDQSLSEDPWLMQGVYRRGISNNLTMYGGGVFAENYFSALAGTALGLPVGAFAFDVTYSSARNVALSGTNDRQTKNMSGQSFRLSYSKMVNTTKTNLSVAAYRFSSKDYLDLGDFVCLNSKDCYAPMHERNRIQLSISQPVGDIGDLNFVGISRDYWDREGSSTTFQVSYGKNFDWGYVNLAASRDLQDNSADNTYMLSFSIPFETGSHRPLLTTSATNGSNHSAIRTSLSGSAGQYSQANYNVYASHSRNSGSSSNIFGSNLGYRTSVAKFEGSYSQGNDYKQYSASSTGTIVAHSGGVVLSPDRGDTMALVIAEGADGASISNGMGNQLNGSGEALISGLTPYRRNSIGISPEGLPMNVELESTSQNAIPRRGAVVRLNYATISGTPLLLQVPDNIPFGAMVLNDKGEQIAIVGQGGLIFLRGTHQDLNVVWGAGSENRCRLEYQVTDKNEESSPYQRIDARCVTSGKINPQGGE